MDMTKAQRKELAAFLAGWADKMSVAGFVACFLYDKFIGGIIVGAVFFVMALALKYWSMK